MEWKVMAEKTLEKWSNFACPHALFLQAWSQISVLLCVDVYAAQAYHIYLDPNLKT